MFPIWQHLSAEAQGWQDNMASALFPRSKGVGYPFFHFLHARAGTMIGPLWGRHPDRLGLVSFDHAQRWGHVARRHQELTTFSTHVWCWFIRSSELMRKSIQVVAVCESCIKQDTVIHCSYLGNESKTTKYKTYGPQIKGYVNLKMQQFKLPMQNK